MISSQTRHHVEGFDEILQLNDNDFARTGLKSTSAIRVGRLAVVGGETMLGAIGEINANRLKRIKARLAKWLTESGE